MTGVDVKARSGVAKVNGRSLPLVAEDLQALLPHRYPVALLDRVTEVVPGQQARGTRLVSRNDPCFAGHFPERPILPGVLLIESLAQLAGVVLWSSGRLVDDQRVGVLAGVKRFRFRRMIVPGDVVELRAELRATVGEVGEYQVAAHVDRAPAADGVLLIALAHVP